MDDAGECCPKNLCDFVHTADQTPCAAALVEVTNTPEEEEDDDTSKPPTDAVPGEEEGDTSKPPTDAAPEEESDPSKPPTDILADESSGEDSTDKPPTSDEVHVTEIPSSNPCAEQVCIMVVLECADGETRKVAEGDCCESCVVDAPATTAEFDCRTKEVWSEKKVMWCCENHNLGCHVISDVIVPGKEIEESEAVEESARAEIHTGVYLTIALGGVMLACIAGYAMHVKNSDGHSRLRAVKEALVINPDDLYRDDNAVVIVDGNGRAAFNGHSNV